MKRQLRAGEWALLLVPCAVLAGFAWWQSRAKSEYPASSDPTAPLILKAKLEPVTPFDVSQGWDTRFVLEAQVPSHLRPTPGNYDTSAQADLTNETLHFEREGRQIVLPTTNRRMFHRILSNGERTTTTLLMKLRDLPVTASPVTLHADVVAHYWRSAKVGGITRNINTQSQPIALKIPVRRAKERVVLPTVSRHRPFALDSVSIKHEDIYRGKTIQADTTVKMIFRATDPLQPQFTPVLHNIRLVDERGKEYQTFYSPTTKRAVSAMWRSPNANDSPDGKYHQWISFPVGFLPKSAGRIVFKTEVSVDNCWPLPLSVVVREK